MKELSGLTTKEISARSGIPEPTLEKIFAGATKDPKLETMRQLVHFFGFTLDDLEATTEIIKKSPATNDTVSGEAVMDIFNYLNEGLKMCIRDRDFRRFLTCVRIPSAYRYFPGT